MARRAAVGVALLSVALVAAARADFYPADLPDFSHPGTLHVPYYYFDARVGTTPRPLLVVYVHFLDVPDPPGTGLVWAEQRFFGDSFPSVADYFRTNSFGALSVSPAAETEGKPGDGIVEVSSLKAIEWPETQEARNRLALELADPFVDYASFDDDDSDAVEADELALIVLYADGSGGVDNCASARAVDAVTLDGVTFPILGAPLSTSTNLMSIIHEVQHGLFWTRDYYGFGVGNFDFGAPTCGAEGMFMAANAYHKLHLGWQTPTIVTRDGYYDVPNAYTSNRSFLLYDPARGTDDYFLVENRQRQAGTYEQSAQDSGLVIWRVADTQYNTSTETDRPIELMRPSGIRATGCTTTFARAGAAIAEGQLVRTGPAPETVIVGTANTSFPVGRALATVAPGQQLTIAMFGRFAMTAEGTIAMGASLVAGADGKVKTAPTPLAGVVIGTAASAATDGASVQVNLALSGGCSRGTNTDAWDPGDSRTPQRTMDRPWLDGAAAKVAVRAIGPSAQTIRAYFDVRGPGVLVDCPPGETVTLDPGLANTFAVPVMNTGEAADTFRFHVPALPLGWSVTEQTRTLGSAEASAATLSLTVPADAAPGDFSVQVFGESTTDPAVWSACSQSVRVALTPTRLDFTGPTRVATGAPAGLRAVLTEQATGLPVAGSEVTFRLSGDTGTFSVTRHTDAAGVAEASPPLPLPPGTYDLSVTTPRNARWAGTSLLLNGYLVDRRPTAIEYTGTITGQWSDPAQVSARLTDVLTGMPIPGKAVTLAIGAQQFTLTTDADGRVSGAITLTQVPGPYTVSATFAGDATYLDGYGSARFDIWKELVFRWRYTGDTTAFVGGAPYVAAIADPEFDLSPADISLAGAEFRLRPLLPGAVPFVETATVDASGLGWIMPAGLPANVYAVSVYVPASNPYWEGGTDDVALLAVTDPERSVNGSGAAGSGKAVIRVSVAAGLSAGRLLGNVRLVTPAGTFTSSSLAWSVVSGNEAQILAYGDFAGIPATLELHVVDGGTRPADDSIEASVSAPGVAVLFTSGTVPLTSGNLRIR